MTPFGEILKKVVEQPPGALGGAFADLQGEMVDSFVSESAKGGYATYMDLVSKHNLELK